MALKTMTAAQTVRVRGLAGDDSYRFVKARTAKKWHVASLRSSVTVCGNWLGRNGWGRQSMVVPADQACQRCAGYYEQQTQESK